MKIIINKTSWVSLITAWSIAVIYLLVVSACEDQEAKPAEPIETLPEELYEVFEEEDITSEETPLENYPLEITFAEYSLESPSCQWKKMNEYYEVFFIDSDEELEKYIECNDEISYTEIDFSKYTLVLARGLASSTFINLKCNSLSKVSEQSYEMNISYSLSYATVLSYWHFPVIVNKVGDGCNIDLVLNVK